MVVTGKRRVVPGLRAHVPRKRSLPPVYHWRRTSITDERRIWAPTDGEQHRCAVSVVSRAESVLECREHR